MQDRERFVDITKMSEIDADNLSKQLGQKVSEICDEAVNKANKLLNIYGLSSMMQLVVKSKEEIEQMKQMKQTDKKAPKKAKSRNNKKTNL